jgi:hypothetical protein
MPWQVSDTDVTKAQQWATTQVEGIAETYETLLRHALEELPAERAIGDVIGKAKQIIAAVGEWINGFLPWKVKQIAGQTWGTGTNDGTNEWISDAQGDDVEGNPDNVRVRIEPSSSSSDICAEFAGKEYSLTEYWDSGISLPAHINCVHTAEIIPASQSLSRSAKVTQELMYLFLDLDGVFSIPNADLSTVEIDGKEAWSIPQANAILQALQHDDRVQPFWLTHWGNKANDWNDRAGIVHWPVWYPLSALKEATAQRLYPELDKKLLAIQYCMHMNNIQSAVWLQDGFAPEEVEWAGQHDVRLVDSNEEPLHALLLSDNADVAIDLIGILHGSEVLI